MGNQEWLPLLFPQIATKKVKIGNNIYLLNYSLELLTTLWLQTMLDRIDLLDLLLKLYISLWQKLTAEMPKTVNIVRNFITVLANEQH